MSTAPVTFNPNERVLCYHGPMVYEAKVLKSEDHPDPHPKTGSIGPHYLVHYKGWKQTWDEWVPPARLLKWNETNLALQKNLQANVAKPSAKSTKHDGKQSERRKGDGTGSRGVKRGRDEDDNSRKPDLKFNIPEPLKVLLVDDWEAVTKNSQLVTLPRNPNVETLLDRYKSYIMNLAKPPPFPQVLPQIISGLQAYFDKSLGANLLYRFERAQYAEVRKRYITGPDVQVGTEPEMSSIYGAEHLLRMIVSLPGIVASSTLDGESVSILREYIIELLNFMAQEKENIFQVEYDSASPAYQNVARS
ncbi:MRG-domain-containing protein [Sistotremastrum niveocremeum HHB9708]|uniref:Chromatin modification-related protein EAF3 n=2 Tax=Sistotremastraceae TaxID=3402574 RepID=A0A164WMF4_9AGAM|nr:MRG-domain-containing protein [Sistotremastrum niveocremeum HHB9708]KZT38679.1 MRG-domain-containing protein [Sistotremastrum suecicum HHB10207 ss-3]